jgi:lysophospholipid acyltransferase (LPLAT)-like uncharacterized protein
VSFIKNILIYFFYRTLMFSWRIHVFVDPKTEALIQNKTPIILAHWHGDELGLLHLVSRYRVATMTSTSKDGASMNFLIHCLGGVTSRGSSTRGGVSALKGLLRLLRTRKITSISVDGPRGPIYKAKPGVFELSRLGHAHIVPVGVSCVSRMVFERSWNKIFIPYPFTRVQTVLGAPLPLLTKADDPRDAKFAKLLESQINDANALASKLIAAKNSEC